MIKMMMVAAGMSVGFLMTPLAMTTPAQAGVNIDINIGGKNRISCWQGAQIVDDYGFNRVRTRECNGSTYTYFARRKGKNFIVYVDSRRGRVTDVRRNYEW